MRRRPDRIWKRWVVRGVVFGLLGSAATLASLFWAWTSPGLLRETVIQEFQRALPLATVDLESASMRLLGGITLRDLRLSRRDDLTRSDFFHVPLAVLYHDKEQLIDGVLAIRKVELKGPRMRLSRGRDGAWNLSQIQGGDGTPLAGFPTVVVERGSLLIEDLGPGRASSRGPMSIEVKDLSILAINDPPGKLRVEAKGASDLLGPVRIAWSHRTQGEGWTCRVEIPEISIGLEANEFLMSYLPDSIQGQLRLVSGVASIVLEGGSLEPAGKGQWKAMVSARDVELSMPWLPWPIKGVSAKATVSEGRLRSLESRGMAGTGTVEARASDVGLAEGGSWTKLASIEGAWSVEARDITVPPGLLGRSPWPCPAIETLFRPSGMTDIAYKHEKATGGPAGATRDVIEVRPRGASGNFQFFPCPLSEARGLVRAELRGPTPPRVDIDMKGKGAGAPVEVKGALRIDPGPWGIDVSVTADGVPVGKDILAAIPPNYEAIASQFHPEGGKADVKARVIRSAGETALSSWYTIGLSGMSARHDAFPLPLKQVKGTIDIRPDGWDCRDFTGEHGNGVVRAAGRDFPEPGGGKGFRLVLRGENIPVTEDLRSAMAASSAGGRAILAEAMKGLGVSGCLGFDADVVRKTSPLPDLQAEVALRGATMTPRFMPCRLDDVHFVCRYSSDRVVLKELSFRRGESRVRAAEGMVAFRNGGGYRARLEKLEADPFYLDDELIAALPPAPRRAAQALALKAPITLAGSLTVDSNPDSGPVPAVEWEGVAKLSDAGVRAGIDFTGLTGSVACHGRYNGSAIESLSGHAALDRVVAGGQPVSPARARFEVRPDTPDTLRFWELQGELFGGVVGGQGRLEFSARPRFEIDMRAARVDLAKVASHNGIDSSEIQGLGHAWLRLAGEVNDLGSLRGEGALDAPQARMYQLPVLLDLVKALGLRVPDRTAFEQARARYTIEGAQVRFQKLDLYGNAISLRGTGAVGLEDLDTHLDFHVDLARLNQVLPAVVDEIPKAVSNQLLTLRVRGKPGNLRIDKQLLPVLNDPLRRLAESVQP
jgi:hypothetical protein